MSNPPAPGEPPRRPCARVAGPLTQGFAARLLVLIICTAGAVILIVAGQGLSAVAVLLAVGVASAEIASRLLGSVPRHPGV